MMNRRDFLTALAAVNFSPSAMMAQEQRHILSNLTSLRSPDLAPFVPAPDKHIIALFMTVQQSYISCGEDLLGIRQIIDYMGLQDRVTPVVIMPSARLQTDPQDSRNFDSIWSGYTDFEILTAPIEELEQITAQTDGAFYDYDDQGRIRGHTRQAIFFDPNGNQVGNFRADSLYHSYFDRINRIFQQCRRNMIGLPVCR